MKRIEFLIQALTIQIFFLIPLTSKAAITDCKTCGLMEGGSVLLGYLTILGITVIILGSIYIVFQKALKNYHEHNKMQHHS
jgi:hypothetical protein